MKFVRNLENIFEKCIEGYFNKKFHSELQPVEVAKNLVKEMDAKRSVSIANVYVPNCYTIYFNTNDYERLNSYAQVFCNDWSYYLQKEASHKNYLIVGKPVIEIKTDEAIAIGEFKITSFFSQPIPQEDELIKATSIAVEVQEDKLSDTRVFDKVKLKDTFRGGIVGLLTMIQGNDISRKVDFFATRVNIGRRESNELALTDMNTSRLHAYIVYEENSHVIYDAKSLNGTYVNDQRIIRWQLKTGDHIKVGNTTILYEVGKFA